MVATETVIRIPEMPWFGDTETTLTFPASWDVRYCAMRGERAHRLTPTQMRAAFDHPIGTPPLREMARGRKRVAILFDDMARGTPTAEMVPYVLDELKAAGVPDSAIRFIAALGTHGAMRRWDFVKKLGEDVVERFPVYNHNPYENCVEVGTTRRGTKAVLNAEVMSCDLKIALGGIVPHPLAGFGGGAKVLCPGVGFVDTVFANHHDIGGRGKPAAGKPVGDLKQGVGRAIVEGNPVREDMEEIARLAGLDMIVNCVMNLRREIVGLYVGDVVAAHRAGCAQGMEVYATPRPGPCDVVIANAYHKANEALITLSVAPEALRPEGGTFVLIYNTPEGQIPHYLSRSFGTEMGGRLWGAHKGLPPRTKKLIALSRYGERAGADWFGPLDAVVWRRMWADVLRDLEQDYPRGGRVAVLPDATVQYWR